MRRALCGVAMALAVALGAARGAAAGPFDTYQLIMWQEHSAAEVAGLKRLGFTGIKVRATGGTMDPAELARAVATGLPWYLENIATDLYASYHRYTEGRSVSWRYEDARARRRADPADSSVFVREPGLSDPAWRARIAERLRALAAAQRQYRPLFYNLADESGIADLAAAWDFDLAPASLAGFRDWLRGQYGGLDALNAEWGTQYAGWDAVQPELTDAALRRTDGNYAAWSDFKAWMDVAFARSVRAATDALHAADAQALAGLEGAQVPGWGGYDYALLAGSVDVMEIYDFGDAVALAKAANPGLIVLRTVFDPADAAGLWRSVLQGGRGTIVWDEGVIVAPDGSAKPGGAALARTVAEIRAVAPTLFAAKPAPDPVAVLVSQASFRARWLLDRKPGGAAWSDRDAGRENEDNAWRGARREVLQRLGGLGVQPHLLSTPAVEAGALRQDGIRLLILPHCIALSDAEVAAIKQFKAAGGTVLADTEPGLFDGHLRLRAAAPLAGVATVPEAMLRTGMPPDPGTLAAEAGLLRAAGVVPRAAFLAAGGGLAPGLEPRWFTAADGAVLLSIQAAIPGTAPAEVDLVLPGPRAIADLRAPSPPVTAERLHLRLDPATPTILSLKP